MASYIPGTNAYKVRKGLAFAEKMSNRYDSGQALNELEKRIKFCQNSKYCPYSKIELRDLADRICPGLGNVDSIWNMIDAVIIKK